MLCASQIHSDPTRLATETAAAQPRPPPSPRACPGPAGPQSLTSESSSRFMNSEPTRLATEIAAARLPSPRVPPRPAGALGQGSDSEGARGRAARPSESPERGRAAASGTPSESLSCAGAGGPPADRAARLDGRRAAPSHRCAPAPPRPAARGPTADSDSPLELSGPRSSRRRFPWPLGSLGASTKQPLPRRAAIRLLRPKEVSGGSASWKSARRTLLCRRHGIAAGMCDCGGCIGRDSGSLASQMRRVSQCV